MRLPHAKAAPPAGAAPYPRSAAVFRREGEYWTVAYEGQVLRLRDTKGLRCVAHLLHHPGERFSPPDLIIVSHDGAGDPHPRTDGRRDGGPADRERARVLITKHIRAAIAKIAAHHASLGHQLGTCIKTGSHCVYMPDPQRAPPWTA